MSVGWLSSRNSVGDPKIAEIDFTDVLSSTRLRESEESSCDEIYSNQLEQFKVELKQLSQSICEEVQLLSNQFWSNLTIEDLESYSMADRIQQFYDCITQIFGWQEDGLNNLLLQFRKSSFDKDQVVEKLDLKFRKLSQEVHKEVKILSAQFWTNFRVEDLEPYWITDRFNQFHDCVAQIFGWQNDEMANLVLKIKKLLMRKVKESGDPSKNKSYLPADKQYLVTRNVPCLRRAISVEKEYEAASGEVLLDPEDSDGWLAIHGKLKATKSDEVENLPSMETLKISEEKIIQSITIYFGGKEEEDIPDMAESDDSKFAAPVVYCDDLIVQDGSLCHQNRDKHHKCDQVFYSTNYVFDPGGCHLISLKGLKLLTIYLWNVVHSLACLFITYDWINKQKSNQNWLRKEGDKFLSPGGGTVFPKGVSAYVDAMQDLIPGMRDGTIYTAIDTGCGVASWEGDLLDRGILIVSLAPRDNHEAQVQFALERGIPAILGVISTQRLPFPSNSFDMAHCSRCLLPWTEFGGIHLIEIHIILRPGGFWILLGQPVNYKHRWKGWNTTIEEQEKDYNKLQKLLSSMCFKLYAQKANIVVWQKTSHNGCYDKLSADAYPPKCDDSTEADSAWYTPMRSCLNVPNKKKLKKISLKSTPKWPERLRVTPERIAVVSGSSSIALKHVDSKWKVRVKHYESLLPALGTEKDTNGGLVDIVVQSGGYQLGVSSERAILAYDTRR